MTKVSIKDVANKAGVSVATVSRVLSGSNLVNEKTETLVLDCIKELNYKPNILARQLRNQKTNTVNIIVPDIMSQFFGNVIRGIENVARENGYEVYIVDVNRSKDIERNYISALTQKQVDGIISLSATTAIKTIEEISAGFPIVIAGQYFEETRLPSVGIDNAKAAKDMTEYLISLGHTKIAYLSTFPNSLLYRDRVTGYLRALDEHDIKIDMQRVFYADDTSYKSGYLAAKEILSTTDITAISTSGDYLALGVIKAAQEMGLRVPEDLSVTGFDDVECAYYSPFELTTIHQPMYEMGKKSMELLISAIDGIKIKNKRNILDYTLIKRKSTTFAKEQ